MLASLLSHERVRAGPDIEAAFSAFDRSRRERAQWVVQKSRRAGQLYEQQTEIGGDFSRMSEELRETLSTIWEYDTEEAIKTALLELDNA